MSSAISLSRIHPESERLHKRQKWDCYRGAFGNRLASYGAPHTHIQQWTVNAKHLKRDYSIMLLKSWQ